MNRETIIAIFLGFAGGILIAFLIITVPKKLPSLTREKPTPIPVTENKEKENKAELTVTTPENESFIEGEEVKIEGNTVKNAVVVIAGPSEDKVLSADNNGNFATSLSIYEGQNLISVTAYLEDGKIATKELTVFASKETL